MVPPNDKMSILFDLQGFGIRNCDVVALVSIEAAFDIDSMLLTLTKKKAQCCKVLGGLLPGGTGAHVHSSSTVDLRSSLESDKGPA